MTTTDNPALHSRSISQRQAAVEAMEPGDARDLAELRLDELVYIRDCQKLRDSGVAAKCNQIDATKDGVANPNRPFLRGECCAEHRVLRQRRLGLDRRAAELGVERNTDMTQVISD